MKLKAGKYAEREAPLAPPAPPWGAEPLEVPESFEADGDPGEIVARPDGYHWIAPNGKQEFGPFETLESAQAYRDALDENAPAPAETVQEAEAEIGIADWIDPETGQPAEGYCPPHLEEG